MIGGPFDDRIVAISGTTRSRRRRQRRPAGRQRRRSPGGRRRERSAERRRRQRRARRRRGRRHGRLRRPLRPGRPGPARRDRDHRPGQRRRVRETDNLFSFEGARGSSHADVLRGGPGPNILVGGASDVLDGDAGGDADDRRRRPRPRGLLGPAGARARVPRQRVPTTAAPARRQHRRLRRGHRRRRCAATSWTATTGATACSGRRPRRPARPRRRGHARRRRRRRPLIGGEGGDALIGGPGLDSFQGGEGDDRVDARDGRRDGVEVRRRDGHRLRRPHRPGRRRLRARALVRRACGGPRRRRGRAAHRCQRAGAPPRTRRPTRRRRCCRGRPRAVPERPSLAPAISGDRQLAALTAFTSFASDLVPGDTNGLPDVFVVRRADPLADALRGLPWRPAGRRSSSAAGGRRPPTGCPTARTWTATRSTTGSTPPTGPRAATSRTAWRSCRRRRTWCPATPTACPTASWPTCAAADRARHRRLARPPGARVDLRDRGRRLVRAGRIHVGRAGAGADPLGVQARRQPAPAAAWSRPRRAGRSARCTCACCRRPASATTSACAASRSWPAPERPRGQPGRATTWRWGSSAAAATAGPAAASPRRRRRLHERGDQPGPRRPLAGGRRLQDLVRAHVLQAPRPGDLRARAARHGVGGARGRAATARPAGPINPNGRYVAFATQATDVLPCVRLQAGTVCDTNGLSDVAVVDTSARRPLALGVGVRRDRAAGQRRRRGLR